MSLSPDVDKIKGLGIRLAPEVVSAAANLLEESALHFSAEEKRALKPIILAKAADIVLADGREDVTKPDLERVSRFCFVLHVCIKSLLASRDVNGSVFTAADAELLASIGIDSISKLSSTPTHKIVDDALTHVKSSNPMVEVTASDIDRFSKRVELWKLQSDAALEYLNSKY